MKDIFCLDIETIPRAQWRGQDYKPDMYWRKQRWMEQQATGGNAPTPERPDYPMQLTGDLPATHPATAHVVSVSVALDLSKARQGLLELPGFNAGAEVIQVDKHLPPLDMGGGEDRPPKLSEITDAEMLSAERLVIALAFEKLEWAVRNRCTIVTFNGKGFDLPMLRWRAAMLDVPVPQLSWYELLYPYRHKEHIDLRLLFSDGDRRARGTMAMWCEAFGIDAKTVGSGADVLGWVEKGDWNTLLSYGLDEMEDLIRLFRAVEGAL